MATPVASAHPTRRQALQALALLSGAPAWVCAQESPGFVVRPLQRVRAPGWTATDLQGHTWSPRALQGRAVLLNFWASWCAPCREEMPALQALQAQLGERNVQVLLVNYRESQERARSFVEQQQWQLPVLTDTSGAWAKQWGIGIFPSSVLIDAKGRASALVVGAVDWPAYAHAPWMRAWLLGAG